MGAAARLPPMALLTRSGCPYVLVLGTLVRRRAAGSRSDASPRSGQEVRLGYGKEEPKDAVDSYEATGTDDAE